MEKNKIKIERKQGRTTCCQLRLVHRLRGREHSQHDLGHNALLDKGEVLVSEAHANIWQARQSTSQSHVAITGSCVNHGSEVVAAQQLRAKVQRAAMPKHRLFSAHLAGAHATMAFSFSSSAATDSNSVLAKQINLVLPGGHDMKKNDDKTVKHR